MRLPFLLIAAFGALNAGAAVAKECRMPDLPPGVRVQMPPGCGKPDQPRVSDDARRDGLKGEQGFMDLGNGTKVRVGGRVRGEAGFSR